MTQGTYQWFLDRAKRQGYSAIGLTLEFKPGMGYDQPYPISEREWPIFLADIPVYTRAEPEVWAYDSTKWALPI